MRFDIWRSSLPVGESGQSKPVPEAVDIGQRIYCEGCVEGGCDCRRFPFMSSTSISVGLWSLRIGRGALSCNRRTIITITGRSSCDRHQVAFHLAGEPGHLMVDTITPGFARRYRAWCEIHAPLDLDHFDGVHDEEPNPACPKCQAAERR